jgi:signal transduction histidine kinase
MNRLHLRLSFAFFLVIAAVGSLAALLIRPMSLKAASLSLERTAEQIAAALGEDWSDREQVTRMVEERSWEDDVTLTVLDRAGMTLAESGFPHPPGAPSGMMPPPRHPPPGQPPPRVPPRPPPGHSPPPHPRAEFHVERPIERDGKIVGTLVLDPRSPERLMERALYVLVGPVALTGLVAAILILWPVSRRLTRRLRELEEVSSHLERGELSARAGTRGNDEIDRLARRFNAMAEALEEQQKGRRRFFQAVSHELRSPLARLRVALSLFEESASPEESGTCVANAMRDIQEIDDLVDTMLEVSRGADGRAPLRPGPVDVEELSRSLAEPLGLTLVARGEAAIVHADPVVLGRAIRNILENAVRYAGAEQPVELSVTRESREIHIRFRDHGPGIPDNQRERIFEPFYRADGSRSRGTGGVGLGLALVRRAMEQHGGTARVENAEDGGAVFDLILPDR